VTGFSTGSRVALNDGRICTPPSGLNGGLPKHVNELVRELKKEGAITGDPVAGRKFGAAANPVLRLAKPEM
jgi:hypothetical protein